MNKINFSQDDLDKCKQFSESVDTKLYAKRNQFDATKRIADSMIGKIGELTVYYNFLEKYPTITYPDFNIYPANKKSWDYDLKHETFNLHVKTQEVLQGAKFGVSWIFQNEDKHIFKTYSENDYVAFVSVNMLQKHGEIKHILPVTLLHEMSLFKKPVLAKLASKSAVYFEDINSLDLHLLNLE
jgi:hypothetical protein